MVYEAGPDDYAGGPSDLTLLPRFGGHVACRIWVDADVSISLMFILLLLLFIQLILIIILLI